MSDPTPPIANPVSPDRMPDFLDELESAAYDMALFTRVVAFLADDVMEEFQGPSTWKVEALAMLCNKMKIMAQKLSRMSEEARGHVP